MKDLTLIQRLGLVQSKLKAPKGQVNNFGKYKYRSCEDILEAVKPLLNEYELTMTLNDSVQLIGERYYLKAQVAVYFGENHIVTTGYAREAEDKKGMDASQVTGAASSYARKYALNAMFLIDDTKDADATNTHGKSKSKNDEVMGLILKATGGGKNQGLLAEILNDIGVANGAEILAEKDEKLLNGWLSYLKKR